MSISICDMPTITCESNITVPYVTRTADPSGISHQCTVNQTAIILGISYTLLSFTRTFRISSQRTSTSLPRYAVIYDGSPIFCGVGISSTNTGSIQENCTQEIIIPMYLNLKDKVFVYSKKTETVIFSASAHTQPARIKGKWGVAEYTKFVIRKTGNELLHTIEEFFVVKEGISTRIYSCDNYTNPFDEIGYTGTWGLYGDSVHTGNGGMTDPSVRQILLWEIPPSLGIPVDFGPEANPSINDYGFYDYNAKGAGFVDSGLGAEDGGKDYFYPKWLRSMTPNPIIRAFADERWFSIKENVLPATQESWTAPTPYTHTLPMGSFVQDNKGNYVHSAIFSAMDGERIIHNDSNIPNIFIKIDACGQPLSGDNRLYFPLSIVSGMSSTGSSSSSSGSSSGSGNGGSGSSGGGSTGSGLNTIDNVNNTIAANSNNQCITDDFGTNITDDTGVYIYA